MMNNTDIRLQVEERLERLGRNIDEELAPAKSRASWQRICMMWKRDETGQC